MISNKANEKLILFICGCPRSGTTVLWELLMHSSQVFLGLERYAKIIESRSSETLSIEHFESPRFFDVRSSDTHYRSLSNFPRFKPFFPNAGNHLRSAAFVGDKIPKLYLAFPRIAAEFPGARILFLLRNPFDICLSYLRRLRFDGDPWKYDLYDAVRDWNQSLAALDAANNLDLNLQVKVIEYERMFSDSSDTLDKASEIFSWLNLQIDDKVEKFCSSIASRVEQKESRRRDESLTSEEKRFISLNADFERYKKCVSLSSK